MTGASKGIGRALARGFGRDGALWSSPAATRAAATRSPTSCAPKASPRSPSPRTWAIPRRSTTLVAATLEEFGQLDVVVNNAATNPVVTPLLDFPDELIAKLFAVNVIGPLRLARLAARHMAEHGGGSILNIASRSAFAPEPQLGPYSATKAALVTLSKAMALEWADLGVRVNTIAPGPFATEMVAGLFEQDDYRTAMLGSMAQHRIADPDEIVGAALFLTGPDASFITGAVLTVDGGMLP